MKKDIIKINYEKLGLTEQKQNTFNMQGNFLYEKDDIFYFYKDYSHALFLYDSKYNVTDFKSSTPVEYMTYILTFFQLCDKAENKPSIVSLGSSSAENHKNLLSSYYEIEEQSDLNKLSTCPSFFMSYEEEEYQNILNLILEERTKLYQDISTFPKNKIFIILEGLEYSKNITNLSSLITIARSRGVYFLIKISDKEKFDEIYPCESDILDSNCKIKYIFNNSDIVKLEIAREEPMYLKNYARKIDDILNKK